MRDQAESPSSSTDISATAVSDQYADGKAAKVWEYYIGGKHARSKIYRTWIVNYLKSHGVRTILDAACGTGIDSCMLLEEGFYVVSCDLSDKMLKYALKERWERRAEPAFDRWVIEEANWLSLQKDLTGVEGIPQGGFDCVICLGNSFAHLPDLDGELGAQRQAFEQFNAMLRPGGLLLIDHRNYDAMLETGVAPNGENVYYPSQEIVNIQCSNIFRNGEAVMTTLDYTIDVSATMRESDLNKLSEEEILELRSQKFTLSYYPHRRVRFAEMLRKVLGDRCKHHIYGDFKELSDDYVPAYYLHAATKPVEDRSHQREVKRATSVDK